MSLASKTITGVAPPSCRSAPGASTTPCGRYRYTPIPDALETPVRDVSLTDIRASLGSATADALRALRDGRTKDVEKYIRDAALLGRALKRFEMAQERMRLQGGK